MLRVWRIDLLPVCAFHAFKGLVTPRDWNCKRGDVPDIHYIYYIYIHWYVLILLMEPFPSMLNEESVILLMEHICFPINLHTHWAALAIQSRIRTARKSWSAGSRNGGRLLPAAQNQSKTVPPLSQAKPDGDCKKWASVSWYPWFVAFKSTYKKLENPEAAQPFQNRPKPCQKLQYL